MEVCDQLHDSDALLLGERTPGTHSIGGWVGPRADLDAVEKRKLFPYWELNSGHPARTRRYTD
jgi:hypothetical protein